MADEIRALTEQERKEQIEYHLAELKKLRATPRSDWHAGFEALLRIETHKYADRVHIRTEEEIGEVPPRTDFVILVEDEEVAWEKAIFKIFRKINILEYKNPHDSLNERVLRKVCGYANLYIGIAEHEGERPSSPRDRRTYRPVAFFSQLRRDVRSRLRRLAGSRSIPKRSLSLRRCKKTYARRTRVVDRHGF